MNDKSKKLEIKNNNDSDNDFIIEEEVDNTKKTDSLPKDTNLYTDYTPKEGDTTTVEIKYKASGFLVASASNLLLSSVKKNLTF